MPSPAASSAGTRVGVGVVVRSAEGLVLVAERRAEPGRRLAVPGGKLEGSETVEECAVRELAEETGLVLAPGEVRPFHCFLTAEADASWLVVGVEARVERRVEDIRPHEVEPDKVGAFAWIDAATPPAALYPATATLLDRLPLR